MLGIAALVAGLALLVLGIWAATETQETERIRTARAVEQKQKAARDTEERERARAYAAKLAALARELERQPAKTEALFIDAVARRDMRKLIGNEERIRGADDALMADEGFVRYVHETKGSQASALLGVARFDMRCLARAEVLAAPIHVEKPPRRKETDAEHRARRDALLARKFADVMSRFRSEVERWKQVHATLDELGIIDPAERAQYLRRFQELLETEFITEEEPKEEPDDDIEFID